MKPHLWAVYSAAEMYLVPVDVLWDYSPFFQYFDLGSDMRAHVPRGLWERNDPGELRLECKSLKSFCLNPNFLSSQLEFLRFNKGLVSLGWRSWPAESVPADIGLQPYAETLKELRLLNGYMTALDFISLLEHFISLECLQLGWTYSPFRTDRFPTSQGKTSAKIQTLRQLTIFKHNEDPPLMSLLALFLCCPRIEHVVVDMSVILEDSDSDSDSNISLLNPLSRIHETILAWRYLRNKARKQSKAAAGRVRAEKKVIQAFMHSPRETNHGLEKLDIYLHGRPPVTGSSGTFCHSQFQRGCRDLVSLKARLEKFDPQVIVPLVESFKNTLREVDMDCGPSLERSTPFGILGQILGKLVELRRLKFHTRRLYKEESIAVFQGRFQQEGQINGSASVATLPDVHIKQGWVCQYLESLSIGRLSGTNSWLRMGVDLPDKGQTTVTLKAASENYRWEACGLTEFGAEFRESISDRMQTLPALRDLTLGTVHYTTRFVYSEIRLSANSAI